MTFKSYVSNVLGDLHHNQLNTSRSDLRQNNGISNIVKDNYYRNVKSRDVCSLTTDINNKTLTTKDSFDSTAVGPGGRENPCGKTSLIDVPPV